MSTRQRKTPASGGLKETAIKVEKRIEKALTVLWDDLPAWQQDNHYIHSGYRPASSSFQGSLASLGYLHNESVNIYTHLIGALFFTLLSGVLYQILHPRYLSATVSDVVAFSAFFLGAFLCLGMSATFHTISNHSPSVASWGNKLDYIGIVCQITGSFIPSVYFGFYCEPKLQRTYWTMISLLGLACATVSSMDTFRTSAWRPYRAGLFVALGLSAVFPVIHGLGLYGVAGMTDRMGLPWVVSQGLLYILGAGLYAARYPERSAPGKYDIWGSSHQIFHVLVVLAAGTHLYGLLHAFDFYHKAGGQVC